MGKPGTFRIDGYSRKISYGRPRPPTLLGRERYLFKKQIWETMLQTLVVSEQKSHIGLERLPRD